MNYQDPDACSTVTAAISLIPVGGGDVIIKTVSGIGDDPVEINGLKFYYDCTFTLAVIDVPVGEYKVIITLSGDSNVTSLYRTDLFPIFYEFSTVDGFAEIRPNFNLFVEENELSVINRIHLEAVS